MQEDKKKHLIVGSFMGLLAVFVGIKGLLAGWIIIVGWEIQQAVFDTGTPEMLDIVYGIIPFTAIWIVGYVFFKDKDFFTTKNH